MGIIGGQFGYAVLRLLAPRGKAIFQDDDGVEMGGTKLEQFFGNNIFQLIKGKTVIDYGCGCGSQAIEMARNGAAKVIGIDIQEHRLERGRQSATKIGLGEHCVFTTSTNELADIIISKDAFEHFSDPAAILKIMSALLKPGGCVLTAFGPTWLNPYGGHLFSVFPWSHLIFTENAQIRWRSDFKNDGANRFSDVEGGLNQLTISKFERFVADSPFHIDWLETVPVKGIAIFKVKLLREIGTSLVRCKLSLR